MTLTTYCGPRWLWHLTVVWDDVDTSLWTEMTLTPHCGLRWRWHLTAVQAEVDSLLRSEMTLTLYSVFDLCVFFAVRSEMALTPYSMFGLFCSEVHDDADTLQYVWPVLQWGPRWPWPLTEWPCRMTGWWESGASCPPTCRPHASWRSGTDSSCWWWASTPRTSPRTWATSTAPRKVGARSFPSKHAGSDSHPVRIGWEALARSVPDDSYTPACFRTGSVGFSTQILKPVPRAATHIKPVPELHNFFKWVPRVCHRLKPILKATQSLTLVPKAAQLLKLFPIELHNLLTHISTKICPASETGSDTATLSSHSYQSLPS